jgi:hypothetical protein
LDIEYLKRILKEKKLPIINAFIIFSISILIFRNWFLSVKWPAGGDVLGWISRAYLFGPSNRWLYVWRNYSFGFVEGVTLIDLFLSILYSILKNEVFTIKLFLL